MKLHYILAFLMTMGVFGFVQAEPVQATGAFTQNCTLSAELVEHYKSETNFNKYLASIGQPTQIYANGKTLKANRQFALDRCDVVYGGPYDVPSGTQSFKTVGGKVEPRHFGYTELGTLYSNWAFPADLVGPNYDKYVKIQPFHKHPWSNSVVTSKIVGKIPYPKYNNTVNDTLKAQHLNRAVDTFCGGLKSCFDAQGLRGYFDDMNTALGLVLTGNNLINHTSVQSWPRDYTPGSFNTYYTDRTGKLWYATHPMAPYEKLFSDTLDLSIRNITITPSNMFSGTKITKIVILVENNSPRNISNTPLTYGFNGKVYCENISLPANSLTPITITSGQLQCNDPSKKEDLFFPQIGKATQRDFNFTAIVNPNKDNPKGESNYNNNTKTVKMPVRNPNAYVTVSMVSTDNSVTASTAPTGPPSTVSEAIVTVFNNTQTTISNAYNGEKFTIDVFETNYEMEGTEDNRVRPVGYVENPTYSIAPGASQVFKFKLPNQKDRISQEYLVKAKIPDYANESTYEDNRAAARLALQSRIELPDMETCTKIAGYANALNKLCAGHFPKYPSTIFSHGMQTYHFATYRLTPQPIPSYVVNPMIGSGSRQRISYSTVQAPTTFEMKNDGKTRSRMLPRHTDINYKITFNQPNGGKVLVAEGDVRHTLENSCFDIDNIDLVHRPNCDELVLFLPNTDINKFNLPKDYDRTKRVSILEEVIKDTKIPFVNPGVYTFDLAVSEFFMERSQDLITISAAGSAETTEWSSPYWGTKNATNYIPTGASYNGEIYKLSYDYEVQGVKGSN